jgi:hypothetical protein
MKKTALILGLVIVGTLLGVISATASLSCNNLVSSCKSKCCTTGQCGSGTYSGQQCGCKNGDSSVSTTWKIDALKYIEGKGYCNTYTTSGYSIYDYTKKIGSGQCRYQAIVSDDYHYVRYLDGPEPSPQPKLCCNGNPDLLNPIGCIRYTIQAWHTTC